MEMFNPVNLIWFTLLMISVVVNHRIGYRKGIAVTHLTITVPIVKLLMDRGILQATYAESNSPVNADDMTIHLVRLVVEQETSTASE